MCIAQQRPQSNGNAHNAINANFTPNRQNSDTLRRLSHLVFNKEKWRRFAAWSRRNIMKVNARVEIITLWVLNFHVNFAFFALPALFAIFLAILSPYKDIQACVCGGLLVILFSCLILNNQGFLDLPEGSNFRFRVHRLFERRETVEYGSDFTGVSLSVQMKTYKMLPLNHLSRAWGFLADLELPGPFKYASIWIFSTLMKCNREEAEFECLTQYKTISHFFRRKLKPGLRPICPESQIVSPADGKLTHVGPVEGHLLEQVKGIRYSFETFLGPIDFKSENLILPLQKASTLTIKAKSAPNSATSKMAANVSAVKMAPNCTTTEIMAENEFKQLNNDELQVVEQTKDLYTNKEDVEDMFNDQNDDEEECFTFQTLETKLKRTVGDSCITEEFTSLLEIADSCQVLECTGSTALFQAVIYLGPSDYHRFHSPADWVVNERRHFPGKLYSVSPAIVKALPGLFHTNERVVLLGTWAGGFFSMSAVGATNVGSISINFDEGLTTNSRGVSKTGYASRVFEDGVRLSKGIEVGYFNFGSTIVLVFEAPVSYSFQNNPNPRIRVGQGL